MNRFEKWQVANGRELNSEDFGRLYGIEAAGLWKSEQVTATSGAVTLDSLSNVFRQVYSQRPFEGSFPLLESIQREAAVLQLRRVENTYRRVLQDRVRRRDSRPLRPRRGVTFTSASQVPTLNSPLPYDDDDDEE